MKLPFRGCARSHLGGASRIAQDLVCVAALLLVTAAPLAAGLTQAGERHGASAVPPPATGAPGIKPFAALMDDAMNIMHKGMSRAPMDGSADHDFATMMIPHHQGAIDMAKAELIYGKNPVLRRLAQEIIVTQNSEIAVMQAALNRRAIPAPTKQ